MSRSAQICEAKWLLARQKIAGILDVFQNFLTQPAAISAAKMRVEAIGTASNYFRKLLAALMEVVHSQHT